MHPWARRPHSDQAVQSQPDDHEATATMSRCHAGATYELMLPYESSQKGAALELSPVAQSDFGSGMAGPRVRDADLARRRLHVATNVVEGRRPADSGCSMTSSTAVLRSSWCGPHTTGQAAPQALAIPLRACDCRPDGHLPGAAARRGVAP